MFDKTIQIILGTVFAVISYMYGEFDGMMQALLFCMVIDYITGLIAAYKKQEISSKMGFIGLAKKFVMLLIVAIGHVLDVAVFSDAMFIKAAVCGFYIANEGISILENTADVGVPYPDIIIKALKQLNPDKKGESEEHNEPSESNKEILDIFQNLSDDEKTEYLKILKTVQKKDKEE